MSAALPANAQQVWEATLGQLMLRVTRQNYDTWLRHTVGKEFEGTTLVVAAANDLACDWLSTRMRSVVLQSLTAVAGPGLRVRFEPTEPVVMSNAGEPMQPSLLPRHQHAPLNPRYTFATLYEGGFNRLALTAARAITSQDSGYYSPLFVSGSSGNGKTHLLNAIAHEAAAQGIAFLMVSGEQFLSEFTTSIRNRGGAAFRARYHEADLLLVDDAHFLIGKKATLNEFYQTVAGLQDRGHRIVVSGDLSAMNGDAARFTGHLRWGLVAAIEAATVEDRARFVEMKANVQGIDLPDEVTHYLALRVKTSLRDLEGAVNRVIALARISLDPAITLDLAAQALQPFSEAGFNDEHRVEPAELVSAVARRLCVTPVEITGPKRDRALTYARHVAMYLLRHDLGMTYAAIAQLLGKKDHSTVVHACNQLTRDLEGSPELRADVDAVRTALNIRSDSF
ncbi:MAG TPA: DnaA/Hda family protein [Dehalococcoidia bacterium]|nr:DnaA/Hda family protein [Dehalococcoidia bacterium]